MTNFISGPLKRLNISQRRKTAGRNSSGMITIHHRGGGSKRLLRTIDFKRDPSLCTEMVPSKTNQWIWFEGIVERIEYDPNRSSRIALIRWLWTSLCHFEDRAYQAGTATTDATMQQLGANLHSHGIFTYILAYDQIKLGDRVLNLKHSAIHNQKHLFSPIDQKNTHPRTGGKEETELLRPSENRGNCIPLHMIPIGTLIHNIEIRKDQGAKLVRAAGTFAQVVQHWSDSTHCIVRLPSGIDKQIHSQCRATIGIVSNGSHISRKLQKAGNNRWLGKRPVVRGVAMNPIDHPHGGGEGRTKGGRPSVSPWGKPTKGGFKTAMKTKNREKI